MRAGAILVVAAAGFAALVPNVASAADLPAEGCARGQAWNGYRCEWVRPRVSEAPPVYQAPPVYDAPEVYEEPDYVPQPYYVAPPVYAYVAPVYRRPFVRYYGGPRYYAGPRYAWDYGRHHHNRWR